MREYANSWILVSTVFLALELSAVTFTINYFLSKNHEVIIYGYLGCGMLLPMGASLVAFLAARDPRLKISVDFVLDVGVGLVFASVVIAAFSVAYGLFVITHNMHFSVYVLVGILSATLIFYPVCYYKFLNHKKETGNASNK